MPLQEDDLIIVLRKKISKNYIKIFSGLNHPKDEIVQCLIFLISYMVNYLIYKYISQPQIGTDHLRFDLDTFHVLIYEMNGMYVSDYYVKNVVDRYFYANKFQEYYNSLGAMNTAKQQQYS